MKRVFAAILLSLCVSVSLAGDPVTIKEGNKIVGHIIEDGTEENIAFAAILVVETGEGATSNENGQFSLTNLAPGKYTLRVTAMGYEEMSKEVVVSKDYTAVVHFKLKSDNYVIEEVVVSANRNEISRRDAPVVVSVAALPLFEAVNSVDLAKSLNYVTGLRVENNCQNCGFPQVRINGLEGPYSQVLINSRPVVSALSGVYGLDLLQCLQA